MEVVLVFKPPFEDGLDEDCSEEGDWVHMCLLNAKKASRDGWPLVHCSYTSNLWNFAELGFLYLRGLNFQHLHLRF